MLTARTALCALLLSFSAVGAVGCGGHYVMEGESIKNVKSSDRIGVITGANGMIPGAKGDAYIQRAIEAGLMAKGVPVQTIHIEDIKNDFYERPDYDIVTNTQKLSKEMDIEADANALLGLQGINDYTLRRRMAQDGRDLLDDLRIKWDLDYILVVRQEGAYKFNCYMIHTGSRRRVMSFMVDSNKKGWMANFPGPRSRPSIADDQGLTQPQRAKKDLARYIVETVTSHERVASR